MLTCKPEKGNTPVRPILIRESSSSPSIRFLPPFFLETTGTIIYLYLLLLFLLLHPAQPRSSGRSGIPLEFDFPSVIIPLLNARVL